MKRPILTLATSLAFTLAASAVLAQYPTHKDFRPLVFSRPSSTLRSFHRFDYGYGYYSSRVFRSNAAHYSYSYNPAYSYASAYGAAVSPREADRSGYYRSVFGDYGGNPYSGLDASRRLYQFPYLQPRDSFDIYSSPYDYDTNRAYW